MVLDQRNAGASVTNIAGNVFDVDRWAIGGSITSKYTAQRNAGSVTPPTGFTNYLGMTSSSAYSVLTGDYFLVSQAIEGYNVADLGFGTASASSVTLSFLVRSSLTGTFSGSICNSNATRNYVFNYTISAANTWTAISVTIPGDTTGTWATDNTAGLVFRFGLGCGATFTGTAGSWGSSNFVQSTGSVSVVGTSGATFYVTGVQLEKGSTATAFDYRPYGTELSLCQRYYEKSYDQTIVPGAVSNLGMFTSIRGNGIAGTSTTFKATKRTTPTMTGYSPVSGTAANGRDYNSGVDRAIIFDAIGDSAFTVTMGAAAVSSGFGVQWVSSAEL